MDQNKSKNLFGIKNPVWWTQEGDGTLFNTYYPVFSSSQMFPKYFPIGPKITMCFSINKKFVWVYDARDMIRISRRLISLVKKDSQYIPRLYKRWQKQVKDFYQVVNKINKFNWERLSNQEIVRWFRRFDKLYKIEYAPPLLPDYYHEYAEKLLLPKVQNHLKGLPINKQEEAYVSLLSPSKPSFVKEADWSLLRLSLLKKINKSKFLQALKKHTRDYYWLHNNYTYTKYLDEQYWLKELKKKDSRDAARIIKKEKVEFKKIKKDKAHYLKKLKLDKQTVLEIEILDFFSYWQDQRKKANMIANGIIDQFVRELSKRIKIDYWLLKHLTPEEFIAAALGGEIDKKLLAKRLRFSVSVILPNKINILAFPGAEELYKKMFPSNYRKSQVIKGVIANKGKVKGKVRVVTSSKQFSSFRPGEILVASMTRPDYAIILSKAAAIVTNEGGLTCHAAIASRELSIPCVIATKIATKVFKTGDLIEVDANKGRVKKL
jgi:phosphohistidine swiveling domain-containing protein